MTTSNIQYGAALTPAITSLNSLASDVAVGYLVASSILIDNTTEKAIGFEIYLTVSYPNLAPTAGLAALNVYVAPYSGAAWADDGYGDPVDGTDQTVLIGDPTALRFLGTVPVTQNRITTAKRFELWAPPQKFCVVVHNPTGQTLAASGHALRVLPVHYQAV